MFSWEDVDLWYRLARNGKPFFRVPEQLMVYQFHAGNRRQTGYENFQQLIDYLQDKYEEVKNVPCMGCRGKSKPPPISSRTTTTVTSPFLNDADLVIAEYSAPHRNQQPLVGTAGFETKIDGPHMIRARPDNLWHIHYGMRAGGDRFLVHIKDVELQPHVFRVVVNEFPESEKEELLPPEPLTEPPELLVEPVDVPTPQERPVVYTPTLAETAKINLQTLPGVSAKFAKILNADGIETAEDILELGLGGLSAYQGCGEYKAKIILQGVVAMREPVG